MQPISNRITPIFPPSDDIYHLISRAYRRREDALTLIYQLNQIIKGVQQHRGMSMGLLAGTGAEVEAFQLGFDSLQQQLNRRLATLEAFAQTSEDLLSARDIESLDNEWVTIREDWHDDNLSDNFELHSHFIEQLQGQVSALARLFEKPLCSKPSAQPLGVVGADLHAHDARPRPAPAERAEILDVVCQRLPEIIEQVAKVRGLSTFAAAARTLDDRNQRKLQYWVQCSRELNDAICAHAERLQASLDSDMRVFVHYKGLRKKLISVLNAVERKVLYANKINASSQQLFTMASDIIDRYGHALDRGIDLLHQWNRQEFEQWLRLAH